MTHHIATTQKIDAARKVLENKWPYEGMCQSCGWLASLHEYDVEDCDIEYAIEYNNGRIELCCLSDDYENADMHRGVRIQITEGDE